MVFSLLYEMKMTPKLTKLTLTDISSVIIADLLDFYNVKTKPREQVESKQISRDCPVTT